MWTIVWLLPLSPLGSAADAPLGRELSRSYDTAELRIECEALAAKGPHGLGRYHDLNAFMDRLVKRRDERAVRLIISEELPGASYVAARYAELLGPREGVKFARTLRPLSKGWYGAVWRLSFSNGPEVRAYIREIAGDSPSLRPFCYLLDLSRGWGDLVGPAWQDLDSPEILFDGLMEVTLSDLAREYLERFEKNRPLPPRKPGAVPSAQ